MQLPECSTISKLFETSARGLKIKASCCEKLIPFLEELEFAEGFERIILLCNCLQIIYAYTEYEMVSTQEIKEYNKKNKERIDRVFQYTIDNFYEPLKLDAVAKYAGMSVQAFCSYFKKCTKKTYIDFLNEVRIGHACKLLIDSQQPVETICYESGFNTLANFNKQFLKAKKRTPSQYRKSFIKGTVMNRTLENNIK